MTIGAHHDHTDERGFTLIEMILSVTLMGLVTIPIVMAFTLGLKTGKVADELMVGSQAPLLLSSYLTTDVQSADEVQPGSAPCAPPGSQPVLGLLQDDGHDIGYAQTTETEGVRLIRTDCDSGETVTVGFPLESPVAVPVCAPADCATGASVTVTIDPLSLRETSLTIAQRASD